MRRLVGWIGGAVGGIAAYRLWRRGPQAAPGPSSEPAPAPEPAEPDARAEELRARLVESRTAEPAAGTGVEEARAEPVAEAPVEEPPEPESPEDRRSRVYEEGRAAIDEMRSDGANS